MPSVERRLILLALFCLWFGAFVGYRVANDYRTHQPLLVYSDESSNAWRVFGLDEAEKKAHFLVYEGDSKVALITDMQQRIVAQVRKGDGRDLGTGN